MLYPSLNRVETASPVTLGWWYRFLPSPGLNYVGSSNFSRMYRYEIAILERIIDRLNDAGGMTPTISQAIGY